MYLSQVIFSNWLNRPPQFASISPTLLHAFIQNLELMDQKYIRPLSNTQIDLSLTFLQDMEAFPLADWLKSNRIFEQESDELLELKTAWFYELMPEQKVWVLLLFTEIHRSLQSWLDDYSTAHTSEERLFLDDELLRWITYRDQMLTKTNSEWQKNVHECLLGLRLFPIQWAIDADMNKQWKRLKQVFQQNRITVWGRVFELSDKWAFSEAYFFDWTDRFLADSTFISSEWLEFVKHPFVSNRVRMGIWNRLVLDDLKEEEITINTFYFDENKLRLEKENVLESLYLNLDVLRRSTTQSQLKQKILKLTKRLVTIEENEDFKKVKAPNLFSLSSYLKTDLETRLTSLDNLKVSSEGPLYEEKTYLTKANAAEMAGRTIKTIENWINDGNIKGLMVMNVIHVDKASFLEFTNAKKIKMKK